MCVWMGAVTLGTLSIASEMLMLLMEDTLQNNDTGGRK